MNVAERREKGNSADAVLFHAVTAGYIVVSSADRHCHISTVKLKCLYVCGGGDLIINSTCVVVLCCQGPVIVIDSCVIKETHSAIMS